MFLRLAFVALLGLFGLPASAATFKITYEGTISAATILAGNFDLVKAVGRAFSVSYLYDLSEGDRTTTPGLDVLAAVAPDAGLAFPRTLVDAGMSLTYATGSGYTLVQGGSGLTPGFVSSTELMLDTPGLRYLVSAIVIGLGDGPSPVRLDQTGTWAVDPTLSLGQFSYAVIDLATNAAVADHRFELSPESVTVERISQVPLPASGLLLGVALLTLRRRRR